MRGGEEVLQHALACAIACFTYVAAFCGWRVGRGAGVASAEGAMEFLVFSRGCAPRLFVHTRSTSAICACAADWV